MPKLMTLTPKRKPPVDEKEETPLPLPQRDDAFVTPQRAQRQRSTSFDELQPYTHSGRSGSSHHSGRRLSRLEHGVFVALPFCGATCQFLWGKTALQPFWLEAGLPETRMGLWFTTQSLCQLVAILIAPSRRGTFIVGTLALLCLVAGTILIPRNPSAIWLFAASGVFDPLSAALLRLRDAQVDSSDFDRTSEQMFSGLMLGLLLSSSGGTVLHLVGPTPICHLEVATALVLVAAHLRFWRRPVPSERTPDDYGAVGGSHDPLVEVQEDGDDDDHVVLQGRRMLTSMASVMLGIGVTDALVTTVAPLYYQFDLDLGPWALFGVWTSAEIKFSDRLCRRSKL